MRSRGQAAPRRHPIQLFGPLRRFCSFVFILASNLVTAERTEDKGKRGETSVQDTSGPNPILKEKAELTAMMGDVYMEIGW